MTPNQNVKDVLRELGNLAQTIDVVLEDKKVTFLEAFKFVPILMSVPALLPKFKPAHEELLSADNESKADIIAFAEATFDLSNDNSEAIVDDMIGAFVHGARLIAHITKKK